MASSNSKLGSLIVQLHSRTNEAKEAFDQALVELERQKAENEEQYQKQLEQLKIESEKQYQKQLDQLKEERRKWDEEKAIMEKLAASASPIVNLNVGGEKISTSRATLILVEGSLLATMFSGKLEDKLTKDANGCIFLDYDSVLFKCLLNQLRTWSDPAIKRIFRLPVGSEQSFIEFVRLLKFDQRFIDSKRSIITSSIVKVVQPEEKMVLPQEKVVQPEEKMVLPPEKVAQSEEKVVQPEEGVERFRTADNSNFRLTDNDRRCEKLSNVWQCVFGTLNYSTGIHRIRLKLEKGTTNILMGICSQSKPPTGPYFHDKPTTHGWFTHGYVVKNGQDPYREWSHANQNDIIELTINCEEQLLSILNESSGAQNNMPVNINEAPFPWCLLVILNYKENRLSLV